jgi:hypothetical protein
MMSQGNERSIRLVEVKGFVIQTVRNKKRAITRRRDDPGGRNDNIVRIT